MFNPSISPISFQNKYFFVSVSWHQKCFRAAVPFFPYTILHWQASRAGLYRRWHLLICPIRFKSTAVGDDTFDSFWFGVTFFMGWHFLIWFKSINWIFFRGDETFQFSVNQHLCDIFTRWHLLIIPDICHFSYTGKIFGEWNLHRKTPIFRVKSVKKRQYFALNL